MRWPPIDVDETPTEDTDGNALTEEDLKNITPFMLEELERQINQEPMGTKQ